MGKRQHTRKHNTQETQDVSPFPVGDYETARKNADVIKCGSEPHCSSFSTQNIHCNQHGVAGDVRPCLFTRETKCVQMHLWTQRVL